MHTRAIGQIGEDLACKYLEREGFVVVGRNYLRKWGELDIIAKKDKVLHFVEVKSVIENQLIMQDHHKPEDNVHGLKRRHLRRIIETYLSDKGGGLETIFQFHVICVYLDMKTARARFELIKNVIL